MESTTEPSPSLERLRAALAASDDSDLSHLVADLYPAEIARLLESLPADERQSLWQFVPAAVEGDVLAELNDEVRAGLVAVMDAGELVAAAGAMELDDLADVVQDLPEDVTRQVIQSLSIQDQERLQAVLSYPEDTAGGLMNPETVSVRPDVSLDVVIRYLRMRGELPERTDAVFVADRDDRYLGMLPFVRLLTGDPETLVADVMDPSVEPIQATEASAEVAREFQDRDLIVAPVVDAMGRLIGQVTVDDVVDVIRSQADQDILSMAGLAEEDDMFAPVITSSRRRAVWLALHLLLAFGIAAVINLFETTIEQVVLLAVLMPMVAAMGGIAGSQTLTLMVRGLALGRVQSANARSLLRKELAVGCVNGLLYAAIAAAVTIGFFGNWAAAGVVAAALTLNLVIAALFGFGIPLLLRRLRIDPALAGSVVLITVTDLVGFVALLGLGTIFLL